MNPNQSVFLPHKGSPFWSKLEEEEEVIQQEMRAFQELNRVVRRPGRDQHLEHFKHAGIKKHPVHFDLTPNFITAPNTKGIHMRY